MRDHNRISSFKQLNDQYFIIDAPDHGKLHLFFCGCYVFSEVEFYEVLEKHPEVRIIFVSSQWNGYTSSARKLAEKQEIGLFKFEEFVGALNWKNFWEYITRDQAENLKELGIKPPKMIPL